MQKLKSRYSRFSRETTFQGFLELHKSKSRYQKCLWILVMIGRTSMLCYQLREQLLQYFDGETVTKTTRFEDGQSYDFPRLILMITGPTWLDVDNIRELGFTYEEMQVARGYLSSAIAEFASDLQVSGSQIPIEEVKRSLMSKMSQLGIAGIWDLFSKIVWRDLDRRDKAGIVDTVTFTRDVATFMLNNGNATKSVYSKTHKWEFTFDYTAYWRNANASLNFLKLGDTMDILKPILFNPHTDQRLSLLPNHAHMISVDCRLYRRLRGCLKKPRFYYYVGLCKFDCLFETDSYSYTCFRADTSGIGGIEVSNSFLNGRLPLCHLGVSVNGSIRGADIPLNRNLSDSENRERAAALLACKSRCLPVCDSYTTSWSILSAPYELVGTPRGTTQVAVTYPDAEALVVTVEIERYKWHDVISNIGGLVGLWLGASIMSLFQAIYLCCCEEEDKLELPTTIVFNRDGDTIK